MLISEWEQAVAQTAQILSISSPPSIPFPPSSKASTSASGSATEMSTDKPAPEKGKGGKGKRKAATEDEKEESTEGAEGKKAKTGEDGEDGTANGAGDELAKHMAATTANYFGMFEPDSLTMPQVPSHDQMAEALLEVRKKALREEYGV